MAGEHGLSNQPDRHRYGLVRRIARAIDKGFLVWGEAYARGTEASGTTPLPEKQQREPRFAPVTLSEMDMVDLELLDRASSADELNRFLSDTQ